MVIKGNYLYRIDSEHAKVGIYDEILNNFIVMRTKNGHDYIYQEPFKEPLEEIGPIPVMREDMLLNYLRSKEHAYR
jgi:hypothetical protein